MSKKNESKILEIKNLHTYFYTEDGVVKAVDGVDLEVYEGEVLGLVGESGSGKTVTAMSILKLIPQPPGKIVEGDIIFKGQSLIDMSESDLRTLRGNQLAVVFQDPMTSLNPVLTIGEQIAEAIRLHQNASNHDAQIATIKLLELVGIPDASQRLGDYPWQFSGGMRQRVMIALALSCNPDLLIADEPTTALDVTIQAQVLDLMQKLREQFKMSIILITHDIGVIAGNCDRVAIMYAGNIVELSDVVSIVGFVSFLAILIACLGLLGIATYAIERRIKEIGIRKVFGADEAQITYLLSKGFIKLLLISVIISAPMTYFINNLLLQNFANKVDFGIQIILMGSILILALGFITIGTQTLRISRTNPVDILRSE